MLNFVKTETFWFFGQTVNPKDLKSELIYEIYKAWKVHKNCCRQWKLRCSQAANLPAKHLTYINAGVLLSLLSRPFSFDNYLLIARYAAHWACYFVLITFNCYSWFAFIASFTDKCWMGFSEMYFRIAGYGDCWDYTLAYSDIKEN